MDDSDDLGCLGAGVDGGAGEGEAGGTVQEEGVETAEHLSLRTLACVQCDECFIL